MQLLGKPWKPLDSRCWRKHTAVEAPQRAVGQVVFAQEAKLGIRPGRGILWGERERPEPSIACGPCRDRCRQNFSRVGRG